MKNAKTKLSLSFEIFKIIFFIQNDLQKDYHRAYHKSKGYFSRVIWKDLLSCLRDNIALSQQTHFFYCQRLSAEYQ